MKDEDREDTMKAEAAAKERESLAKFTKSKWETVDETELEAQGEYCHSEVKHWNHYLPLDGILQVPIYLVWACWVQNLTTFLHKNCYFKIRTKIK